MKNALRRCIAPSVPLALDLSENDGRTFHLELKLSFDFNALGAFQEKTGINPLEGNVWQNPSPLVLRALFWAALLAEQPEYESDDGLRIAGSYMRPDSAIAIAPATQEAWLVSSGINPTQPAPPAETATTTGPMGSSSGPSLVTTSASARPNSGA